MKNFNYVEGGIAMRKIPSFIAIALVLCVNNGVRAAPGGKDKLQGTWRRAGGMENGKRMSPDKARSVTLTIAGNRFTILKGEEALNDGAIRLYTRSDPSGIDFAAGDKSEEDSVLRGIFKFDGEKLVTCFARAGAVRPTSFESRPGSGRSLMTWVREGGTAPVETAAVGDQESPVAAANRLRERFPTTAPPVQVVIGNAGPKEIELQLIVSKCFPVTEEYTVNVLGMPETRTRTAYKTVMETVAYKALTKHVRVWTEDGKFVEVEAETLPTVLRKGEPILFSPSPSVDPRHMAIYKPGTLIVIPRAEPAPPSGPPGGT